MCPFYFLESKTELSLLENESATFFAKRKETREPTSES